MESLIQDLRYAVRALTWSPGFTLVAVTVLALGIGANTAIFSTLNAVAFATLPYQEPDRLVQILSLGPATDDPPTFMLSGNELIEYRSESAVFENAAGYRNRQLDYRGSYEPVTLSAASVTSNFFRIFGYEAALGRTFGPEHENRSSRGTIVVSDRFWRLYLGADPNAIGKSVTLNRNESVVVGVLEPGYRHVEGENADIFLPVPLDNQETLQARWLTVVARVKPGVTTEQVQAELDLIAPSIEEKYPDRNAGWTTEVAPLRPLLSGEVNPLFYVPYRQFLGESQPRMLAIRTEGDPLAMIDAIHREAADLDSGMIINDIATLDQIKGGFITPQRFSMLLLGIFAGVAVALAAAGIYGVMSYSVSQRTQEIGVRRALGAEAGDLRSMVVRQGLKLVVVGLAIGLVTAVAFTRVLGNLLWGVTATDPVTIGGVVLILATVALLACYLPAWRATRIDPVRALRYE